MIPGLSDEGPAPRLAPASPLIRAIEVLADRWTLLIAYRALFHGTKRFGDFQRELSIPTNVLTQRLQGMVHAGLFERVRAPLGRSPHEYRLTASGARLWPVLGALMFWGDDWRAEDGDAETGLIHRQCGWGLVLGPTCPTCHRDVDISDVVPAALMPRPTGRFVEPLTAQGT